MKHLTIFSLARDIVLRIGQPESLHCSAIGFDCEKKVFVLIRLELLRN